MIAVQSFLEAAGVTVERVTVAQSEFTLRVVLDKDYDLAPWSFGIPNSADGAYVQFQQNLSSAGGRYGFQSEAFDAALDAIRVAEDDEARTAAFNDLAEVWTEEVPSVAIGSRRSFLIQQDGVHGLRPTSQVALLLDDAWIDQ